MNALKRAPNVSAATTMIYQPHCTYSKDNNAGT